MVEVVDVVFLFFFFFFFFVVVILLVVPGRVLVLHEHDVR